MKLENIRRMEKAKIIAERTKAILGMFFLIPPILGVAAFVLQLFDCDTSFSSMRDLSSDWTTNYNEGGGASSAPLYLGLMAIAGALLVKNSLLYLFYYKSKPKEKTENTDNSISPQRAKELFESSRLKEYNERW